MIIVPRLSWYVLLWDLRWSACTPITITGRTEDGSAGSLVVAILYALVTTLAFAMLLVEQGLAACGGSAVMQGLGSNQKSLHMVFQTGTFL